MDSVTEARAAITMAREGGIGILHKNLDPEAQALEVQRVKRAESGMVIAPVTVRPTQLLRDALELMREHGISGVPVTEGDTPVGPWVYTQKVVSHDIEHIVSGLGPK